MISTTGEIGEARLSGPTDVARADPAANKVDAMLTRLMFVQLRQLGLFEATLFSMEDMRKRLDPLYGRWLAESVRILVRLDYLRESNLGYSVGQVLESELIWAEWEGLKAEQPDDPQLTLLDAMVRELPKILSGKILATDVLFATASMHHVEGVYQGNVGADYFNAVVAEGVTAYVEERLGGARVAGDALEPIRIIEVGAGTGATSAAIFAKLRPHAREIHEYCYTDISKAFLVHAKEQFGPRTPYLSYRTFNVEMAPARQGIESGAYDVVIATNVLHATRSIRDTLRNVKALLRRNGLLLLNEMNCSSSSLPTHLTFGLTKGWWLFEDDALRVTGTPALLPATWRAVLQESGFSKVCFPAEAAHQLGQQVILAQSDGVALQPVKLEVGSARASRNVLGASSSQVKPASFVIESVAGRTLEISIREKLVEQICESLGVSASDVEFEVALADYGMDSIIGINFVKALNQTLSTDLDTTVIFDYSSVTQLTSHIVSRYGDLLSNRLTAHAGERVENKSASPAQIDGGATREAKAFVNERYNVASRQPLNKDSIAIIGMAGRFAKSRNLQDLWEHLANGDDLVEESSSVYRATGGREYFSGDGCKHGSFLEGIEEFDPLFFNISGVEATYMDPKQRLFLEESWKALEDAGYTGEKIQGRQCGVFVGAEAGDYHQLIDGPMPPQAMWGNATSVLAARIAYCLDLQGPAIAVDTACSSSLVAVHLACQALRSNEIELAVAGGVSLTCVPSRFDALRSAGMVSPSGRCRTFDARADGFVPGEGVGAVVLMRLEEAIKSGAHIHGVIKGSGINQDGATNGITAPSARSQERLERHVYKTFSIDPARIEMVEAHGTGTELGDPIEIAALSRAFGVDTNRKQFCAIGSIKTNLGHALAASGMAGLFKVLLSLQRKQIPPSLHFESHSPHIDFENSPFYVNTRLKDWIDRRDANGTSVPRLAALSAFGMSGTNAHMVLESYESFPQTDESQDGSKPCWLLALSAKTEEALRWRAKDLVAVLRDERRCWSGQELSALSNTLLNHRQHFSFRWAIVIESRHQAIAVLSAASGGNKTLGLFDGRVDRRFAEQPALMRRAEKLLASLAVQTGDTNKYRETLAELADLYCHGYALDWTSLFAGGARRFVGLPSYPFARERYWIESRSRFVGGQKHSMELHPLIQRNTSNLDGLRFSAKFTGDESFLVGHEVAGSRVLPGVCYLEMARAALAQSIRKGTGADFAPELRNVAWLHPLVVTNTTEVHVGISAADNGDFAFEIYSTAALGSGAGPSEFDVGQELERIVHVLGRANVIERRFEGNGQPLKVDLAALKLRCNSEIDVEECYALLGAGGFSYGAAHRALASMSLGTQADGQRFVLARIEMPACVRETANEFVLHPSIVDCALQASVGLLMDVKTRTDNRKLAQPALPFALERLEILDRCPSISYAVIRPSAEPTRAHHFGPAIAAELPKLDVDLCDEAGRVCARLHGYTTRPLTNVIRDRGLVFPKVTNDGDVQTLLFSSRWEPKMPALSDSATADDERWVLVDGRFEDNVKDLRERWPGVHWEILASTEKNDGQNATAAGFLLAARHVFSRVQSILGGNPRRAVLLQLLLDADHAPGCLRAGLSGLLKSANQENSKFSGQVIEVSGTAREFNLSKIVIENWGSAARSDQEIRYSNDQREVLCLREIAELNNPASLSLPWKDAGVYLITGGVGGLGLIVAREIAARVQRARIILTGRSELTDTMEALIKTTKLNDAYIEYRVMDVSDGNAVRMCVHAILEQYGALNGIIHSAGVVQDGFIFKKSLEEFSTVIAPKAAGAINLDVATANVELDFLILFSSVSGVFGSVGQCDYATGNAFMDRYAEFRSALGNHGARYGRTLSVAWPLWADGGMQGNEVGMERMHQTGLVSLSTGCGIKALYRAWSSDESRVVVLSGNRPKLMHFIRNQESWMPAALNPGVGATSQDNETDVGRANDFRTLHEQTVAYLKKLFAFGLKVPVGRIESDAGLEKYGIDSILALKLVTELEPIFGSLPKTLLFEYQTVDALADYFTDRYPDALIAKLGLDKASSVVTRLTTTASAESAHSLAAKSKLRLDGEVPEPKNKEYGDGASLNATSDIAIVGLGGRYPCANNIAELWENLKQGKDCITEIPPERWDYRDYFDSEKGKHGKSYCKWGGFIDGVDRFDAPFFDVTPEEAPYMDPQIRLFLQCTHQTIEDAGYTRESLQHNHAVGTGANVGVFLGAMYVEYLLHAHGQSSQEPYSLGGNLASIANRVSHFFNFQGPSLTVDTMCSSSLTAIHLACLSLKAGECEAAIAGGVNISIHPSKYLVLARGQHASSSGRCESFGRSGDGYVPGEGVGAVLLKPLSRAIDDEDHIYGVIKGSSINHGGKSNGYTVPNPSAHERVITGALKAARVDPRMISYIEAHGTGTLLGDPIEIAGLANAFGKWTRDEQFCAVGSVKSNIGHSESAAGIAGLTKVLLQMKHRTLVPSLHSANLNPFIKFEETPFRVQQTLQEWTRPIIERNGERCEYPLTAGISSFGGGGANAHTIVQEYVASADPVPYAVVFSQDCPALIVISAADDERLRESALQLLTYLKSHPRADSHLADIAFTLQVGREAMKHRLAFTTVDVGMLEEKLAAYIEDRVEESQIEECYKGDAQQDRDALAILSEDNSLQRVISSWFREGRYTKILELWTKGLAIDWAKLYLERSPYTGIKPRRISLPTYPFARERHWIGSSPLNIRQTRHSLDAHRIDAAVGRPVVIDDATQETDVEGASLLFSRDVGQGSSGNDSIKR